ncbi:50S ribosomal protein L18 [Candidatus Parcubacteria bacterium]|nr:50S ribosomal protein L18 [Candidatus Parcubacteria bacterium]
MKKGTDNHARRKARIRAKLSGTHERPRLAVFRSNKYCYGQLIDDAKGMTIAAASDATAKGKTKTERAKAAGKALAEAALGKKVTKAVFDRGGFAYTGRVKAFADGAREGGLTF